MDPPTSSESRELDIYRLAPSVTLSREMILASGTRTRKKKESVDSSLRKITHLTLQGRNIEEMQNLYFCENLTVLYLHENSIAKIRALNGLKLLTHLFLQNNEIQKIEALDHLVGLEKLYLGGNRIQVVEGLAKLQRLEELHLENQRMPAGESLLFEPRSMMGIKDSLRTLDVSGNNISSLAGVSMLVRLSHLNLKNNQIDNFKSLERVLTSCNHLYELQISRNPIAKVRKFRERIVVMTPSLQSLNDRNINALERQFLINWKSSRKPKADVGEGEGRGLEGGADAPQEHAHHRAEEAHHPPNLTRLPPIHNRGFFGSKKTHIRLKGVPQQHQRAPASAVADIHCTAMPQPDMLSRAGKVGGR